MSDKVYRPAAGFIQFDPRDREVAGKAVRDITIRPLGAKDPDLYIRGTVWPSHRKVELAKGDFVVMEGQYTTRKGERDDGTEVVYHNISVSSLVVIPPVTAERDKVSVSSDPDEGDDGDDPW